MNRRDLLKALIASPVAAAAGSFLVKRENVAPVSVPSKDFIVTESLDYPPECTYSTTVAHRPSIGQEISIEWNGETIFVGKVDRVNASLESCEVHASSEQRPVTYTDFRALWDEADANEYAERMLRRSIRRG